jgi:hypothetical protein
MFDHTSIEELQSRKRTEEEVVSALKKAQSDAQGLSGEIARRSTLIHQLAEEVEKRSKAKTHA